MYFLIITASLTYPWFAHAYIDLGTGSFIVQATIALVAGAALYMKLSWRKIKEFFGHNKREP